MLSRITLKRFSLYKRCFKVVSYLRRQQEMSQLGVPLPEVVKALERIAPLQLAESWDNVGLLVEPTKCQTVKKILLTNDLTEEVIDEAIKIRDVNFIVAYHPPIFTPFKHLTTGHSKERVIIKSIEAGIAVYSPHTAADAVSRGVNDWLASGLGDGTVEPIKCSPLSKGTDKVSLLLKGFKDKKKVAAYVSDLFHKDIESEICQGDDGSVVKLACPKEHLTGILEVAMSTGLQLEMCATPSELSNATVKPGVGRLLKLTEPVSLSDVVERVKCHLKINHVRVALASSKDLSSPIKTVGLCAGSGGSVLSGVKADLYLTGEMSHHAVLEATSNGICVILCEHSNTERGYLGAVLKGSLTSELGSSVDVVISATDKDPLTVV